MRRIFSLERFRAEQAACRAHTPARAAPFVPAVILRKARRGASEPSTPSSEPTTVQVGAALGDPGNRTLAVHPGQRRDLTPLPQPKHGPEDLRAASPSA